MPMDKLGDVIATRAFYRLPSRAKVVATLGKPEPYPDGADYYCTYQVTGLGRDHIRYGAGIDAFQALWHALLMIGAELYTSESAMTRQLKWLEDDNDDLGLPVHDSIRNLLPEIRSSEGHVAPDAHFIEATAREAERSLARMRAAALAAREASARAELVSHMVGAARRRRHLARHEAAHAVVDEWLGAWNLTRADWAAHVPRMEALAGTCHDYVNDPSAANDRAVRDAYAALKAAHDTEDATIEDQMAWRSESALAWWAEIRPVPRDIARNARAPARGPDQPFWTR